MDNVDQRWMVHSQRIRREEGEEIEVFGAVACIDENGSVRGIQIQHHLEAVCKYVTAEDGVYVRGVDP